MIGDKTRKTRRVSKKVKKMHEEVVAKGVLGAEKVGGASTQFMVGYYEDDKLKSKKNVSPPDLNIADMVRSLNDNDYLIIKAFVRTDGSPPSKILGFNVPGTSEEDYAIYFKFKRTSKPKGINQTLDYSK
jgi:hypothetical protein